MACIVCKTNRYGLQLDAEQRSSYPFSDYPHFIDFVTGLDTDYRISSHLLLVRFKAL